MMKPLTFLKQENFPGEEELDFFKTVTIGMSTTT